MNKKKIMVLFVLSLPLYVSMKISLMSIIAFVIKNKMYVRKQFNTKTQEKLQSKLRFNFYKMLFNVH